MTVERLERPVKSGLLRLALLIAPVRLRPVLIALGIAVCFVGITAAAGRQPKLVLGGLAAVGVALLALRRPGAALIALIFLTAVVPYELLNHLSLAGGANTPGVLPSDAFFLAGIGWALLALPHAPLDRMRVCLALAMLAILCIIAFQFLHGVRAGYVVSVVGQETRALAGIGTFLVALPLLAYRRSARTLLAGLTVVLLLLGAWGVLQWFGNVSFSSAGDVGVRSGVAQTTAGTGQLQGGEFAFPVAIVVCFAVLAFGELQSGRWRVLLVAALALNIVSCLVTFERSFWLDAVVGVCFVTLFTGRPARRVKVFTGLVVGVALSLTLLSIVAPAVATTARQRLESIGGYASDSSLRYRVVESQFVSGRIRAHPLDGSGMGATIFWGQPWAQVPPQSRNYSHDGYLWLSWKIGIPAAALVLAIMVAAALPRRAPPGEEVLSVAVRRGAQGAIVGLLVATITFPSFSQLSIAPAMGLLIAIAVSPIVSHDPPGEAYTGAPAA